MDNNKIKIVRYLPLIINQPVEENDTATLIWGVRAGYPRITVYTSKINRLINGKLNYGCMITAPFDFITLGTIMDNLEKIINGENDKVYKTECRNVKYENGVKLDELYLQATVEIGKDNDGVIYFKVYESGKTKVTFPLLPNTKWHKFFDTKGVEVTSPAALSKMYAKSYHNFMEKCYGDDILDQAANITLLDKKGTYNQTAAPTTVDTDGIF